MRTDAKATDKASISLLRPMAEPCLHCKEARISGKVWNSNLPNLEALKGQRHCQLAVRRTGGAQAETGGFDGQGIRRDCRGCALRRLAGGDVAGSQRLSGA